MTEPTDPGQAQVQPARPSDMVLRLQIGIGGVFAVLLLVGLASMIGQSAVDQAESEVAAGGAPPPPTGTAEADQPLVNLGVQPAAPAATAPVAAPVGAPAAPAGAVTDLPATPAPPPKAQ